MLSVRNIDVRYGVTDILKRVTFDAQRGEVTAVIGRNGSGKSTLLKAIAGDVKCRGEVFYDGVSLLDKTIRERARYISVVEQSIAAVPITIRDFVMMGRMPYRSLLSVNYSEVDKEEVQRVLEELSLETIAGRTMDRVSGGERQLAAVAQALVQQPKIMLLDEPVSNLDIVNTYEIYKAVVTKSRERGVVTLMVVHDMQSVMHYADNVIMLRKGQVVEVGKVSEVMKRENLRKVYGVDLEGIGIF